MSKLPNKWVLANLGDLADYTNGKAFTMREWEEEGLPIIRIQNLNDHKASFNYTSVEHDHRLKALKGSLLVSWAASLDAYIWTGKDAWVNQHIFNVHTYDNFVDKKFLYYAIKYAIKDLQSKTRGSGIIHITKSTFENHKIPLPPFAEQLAIVEKLDESNSKIQSCRIKLKDTLENIKRYRQSILLEAIKGNLTKDWREKSGVDDRWNTSLLGDLIQTSGSGQTPKGGETSYKETGTPFIRSQNVISFGFKYEGLAYIDDKQAYDLRNSEVHAGDVLLNITGTSIGRSTIVPPDLDGARINQHVFAIKTQPELLPSFLNYYLSSPLIQRRIVEENYGSTRQALTKQQILNFTVPIPTIAEQIEIVSVIKSKLDFAKKCEIVVKDSYGELDKLFSSIIIKAFRGELSSSKLEDDHASILINNIKTAKFSYQESLVKLQKGAIKQSKKKTNMKAKPAKTFAELFERLENLGGFALPIRLLAETELENDIDTFYDLLREGRNNGSLDVPVGTNSAIKIIKR